MQTAGEQLFEEYLRARGLRFRREPDLGGRKKPDYLILGDPDVLCEVKDLCANDDDRRAGAALARGEIVTAWGDATARARSRIVDAVKQLSEYKGSRPCVVVLYNHSALGVNLLNIWVKAAMHGDAQFSEPIDFGDGRPMPEPAFIYDRDTRKLSSQQNTTVSAVAVLERVRPNPATVDDHVRSGTYASTHDVAMAVFDFLEAHPEATIEAPRLRVIHNRFAAVPLPREVFSGTGDEHE
jgi:hypothetical protein